MTRIDILDKNSPSWKGESSCFKIPTLEEIREARQKRYIAAVLIVYGDDSTDEKGERIFAVAGVMGTQEEWDILKPKWVEHTGGKIFHATDCESGYGDYNGIPKDKRLKEYKDLTQLLVNTKMMGFGFAVDIKAYRTYISDGFEDGPYFYCFVGVVMAFAETAYLHVPRQTVQFIFDINHKVRYNAAFLYDNYITQLDDWKYRSCIEDKIGFTTSKTVEIQVADLFAHETMKHFDNELTNQRRIRKSLDAILDTDRFKCLIYDENKLQKMRDDYNAFEIECGKVGIMRENYDNWLSKHNCQDNCENKTRYLMYLKSI